eukprot:CAMPEP_0169129286 /NCGR_PEP_ID=MMETSP1015-20121227/37044_1 /TAXON_ID=342587 /ORGANISM="Karlodinium micrum, Strain CCMP2283" /LENGTH=67 /DNA_ID=CAMNT_0009193293 /DNA_START=99 /DNA_END=302 /DNA_ORIENTATION=+
MGLQQELNERKPDLVIREESGTDDSLLSQAADSLSCAFESFESSIADGMNSMFGPSEVVPEAVQKVA